MVLHYFIADRHTTWSTWMALLIQSLPFPTEWNHNHNPGKINAMISIFSFLWTDRQAVMTQAVLVLISPHVGAHSGCSGGKRVCLRYFPECLSALVLMANYSWYLSKSKIACLR
jgi:hypothetical protein